MPRIKVRFLAKIKNGYPFSSEDFIESGDIPLIRIRDIKNPEFSTFLPKESVPKESLISNGALIIGMDGDFNSVLWKRGEAALNQRVCSLSPRGETDIRFLNYCLPSKLKAINDVTFSTTVKHLSSEQILNIEVPHVLPAKQARIADYLDRETNQIDHMVKRLDTLVEKLRAREVAVIAGSVRDNLNQYPRVRLQSLVQINSGHEIKAAQIKDSGEYPVYGGNGIRGYTTDCNEKTDRVLIGRQGALCGNVHLAKAPFWVSEHALVLKPFRQLDLRWIAYALQDQRLGTLSMSAAQPGITATGVGLQRVPLPPFEEQCKIADRLDAETAKIDTMIKKATLLRDELTARRSALITEVVTGRKPVN